MAKKSKKQEAEQVVELYDDVDNTGAVKRLVRSGITFGSALAMVISFTTWHSVFWAIIHGLLSWVYVIYYLITYNGIF